MRVPVCGRFYPNEGGVAGYGNRIRVKYTAKWGLQIAKMIFQTRSSSKGSGYWLIASIKSSSIKYSSSGFIVAFNSMMISSFVIDFIVLSP
uniref:DUF6783 domain-containing protein n=1 Tax=Blautia faecicola TaxID=2509240 RepID=UPI003522D4EC